MTRTMTNDEAPMTRRIRNRKSEIGNKFKIRISKIDLADACFEHFKFGHCKLFRILAFGFRLSAFIRHSLFAAVVLIAPIRSSADTFLLPTANHALYEPGQEEKFFVPTPGKSWTSGTFGCVRTEGWQLHEGLDIRCLQRDKKG